MSILTLPDTTEVIAEYPYFPTRQQLFIWRNWGMVKTEVIADVLGTDVKTVNELASDMGLDVPMKYNAEYAKRGFITIIRNNWQVVPYDQLIKCAGMTRDELAFTLKEDDFLGVKLQEKPNVPEIRYTPLTEEQKEQTKKLKAWTEKHFAAYRDKIEVNDFDFIKDYGKPERKMKNMHDRAVCPDSSWGIKNESGNSNVDVFAANFIADTEKEWGVCLKGTEKFITLKIVPDETKKQESHVVEFSADGITVTAVDEEGVNKAFNDAFKTLVNNKVASDLNKVAYVNADVYNILMDSKLATSAKASTVNIDGHNLPLYKGFAIELLPDDLFQEGEQIIFAVDNVGVVGLGIEVFRTVESEDFAGTSVQFAGKYGKYIPEKNNKAIIKAKLTPAV